MRQQSASFDGSYIESRIVEALFQPGPSQDRLEKVTSSYRDLKVGTTSLDCVVLPPIDVTEKSSALDKLPSSYCFSQKPNVIRVVVERYALVLTYNKLTAYSHRFVAKEISISQEGHVRAMLHVTELTPAPDLKEDSFQAESGPDTVSKNLELPAGVLAGHILSKQAPSYPLQAKEKRISGSVILDARIDETGKIAHLEVISTPDQSLALSSIDAVRQWRYTPYLLNGKPTSVTTVITVNYSFGQ